MLELRRWQSGQMHETVNLATYVYGGSNPSRRTNSYNNKALAAFLFSAIVFTYGKTSSTFRC